MTKLEEKMSLELLIEALTKELQKYNNLQSTEPDLSKSVLVEVFFGGDSIATKLTYNDL